jgi:prepilin-type N-terminal cleavage/methylation domain-containing protein
MIRSAFTLIELLVVITIVLLVMGLLIAVIPELRFRANATITVHRMEAVTQGLSICDEDGQGAAFTLHKNIILPATGAGVLSFSVSSYGEAMSSERQPRIGAWLDPSVPWCFSFPWGSASWDDAGAPAPPITKSLADFNPNLTQAFLHAAGVLPTGTSWPTSEEPEASYCDAWGNPLVVAFALYQPKRNTTIMTKVRRFNDSPTDVAVPDTHVRLAEERYRSSRAIYLTVAAAGPYVNSALTGTPADVAAIWPQVLNVCEGAAWNEAGLAHPPWKGVTIGKKKLGNAAARCFLAAPVEVH